MRAVKGLNATIISSARGSRSRRLRIDAFNERSRRGGRFLPVSSIESDRCQTTLAHRRRDYPQLLSSTWRSKRVLHRLGISRRYYRAIEGTSDPLRNQRLYFASASRREESKATAASRSSRLLSRVAKIAIGHIAECDSRVRPSVCPLITFP